VYLLQNVFTIQFLNNNYLLNLMIFLSVPVYDWPIFIRATLILVQGQYLVLKFNMRLLNYPHVDAPLTSYISLRHGPFSSSLVSPHLPRSLRCRWYEYTAMYIRAKNRASTVLSHVILASFLPLRTYAICDKLLPRHQEPRHRMYFYAGDAL